jgi:hypothetical protein
MDSAAPRILGAAPGARDGPLVPATGRPWSSDPTADRATGRAVGVVRGWPGAVATVPRGGEKGAAAYWTRRTVFASDQSRSRA